MGRVAPRSTGPVPGLYPIDTGTAELSPSDGGWLVRINGAESSHIDPDDPRRLDFEYMRQMALVIDEHFDFASRGPRVLHLGPPRVRYPAFSTTATRGHDRLPSRLMRHWPPMRANGSICRAPRHCESGSVTRAPSLRGLPLEPGTSSSAMRSVENGHRPT